MVDARAGLTALDLEVASLLRVSGKRVLTVANKIDAASLEGSEGEAHGLGLGEVVPLSAEQGRGIEHPSPRQLERERLRALDDPRERLCRRASAQPLDVRGQDLERRAGQPHGRERVGVVVGGLALDQPRQGPLQVRAEALERVCRRPPPEMAPQ